MTIFHAGSEEIEEKQPVEMATIVVEMIWEEREISHACVMYVQYLNIRDK